MRRQWERDAEGWQRGRKGVLAIVRSWPRQGARQIQDQICSLPCRQYNFVLGQERTHTHPVYYELYYELGGDQDVIPRVDARSQRSFSLIHNSHYHYHYSLSLPSSKLPFAHFKPNSSLAHSAHSSLTTIILPHTHQSLSLFTITTLLPAPLTHTLRTTPLHQRSSYRKKGLLICC